MRRPRLTPWAMTTIKAKRNQRNPVTSHLCVVNGVERSNNVWYLSSPSGRGKIINQPPNDQIQDERTESLYSRSLKLVAPVDDQLGNVLLPTVAQPPPASRSRSSPSGPIDTRGGRSRTSIPSGRAVIAEPGRGRGSRGFRGEPGAGACSGSVGGRRRRGVRPVL